MDRKFEYKPIPVGKIELSREIMTKDHEGKISRLMVIRHRLQSGINDLLLAVKCIDIKSNRIVTLSPDKLVEPGRKKLRWD